MVLYDVLAPAYDAAFESIFRPFRKRALAFLPEGKRTTILDLACGTGQNFPFLAECVGPHGKIIGVDVSSGMLRRARWRRERMGRPDTLIQMDAAHPCRMESPVDFITCTYSFTSMREWKTAFHNSWHWLKPGGGYLIHDIDGQRRNIHTRAVEFATRSHFADKVWEPLQSVSRDFRMDYIEPSAHLFGGRLFVAYGTKPLPLSDAPCPS
jgi:ubiquinone/menaquinone biosynthesis C-methylase UbiE